MDDYFADSSAISPVAFLFSFFTIPELVSDLAPNTDVRLVDDCAPWELPPNIGWVLL